MEAGADEGCIIVEDTVRDGANEGKRNQAVRKGEMDAGKKQQAGCDAHRQRDDDEGDVERRSQGRIFLAHALGIKPRRAKAQAIEKAGLHRDRDGEGERETAVFSRPQKLRDQQPDREIAEHVEEKGGENPHAFGSGAGANAKRWRAPGEAVAWHGSLWLAFHRDSCGECLAVKLPRRHRTGVNLLPVAWASRKCDASGFPSPLYSV